MADVLREATVSDLRVQQLTDLLEQTMTHTNPRPSRL